MGTQVEEAPARAQAPCHVTHDGCEIFHVGVEEHASRCGHRCILHGKLPGIGPDGGTEPAPGEPELISRDVEPYGAIACVRQNPPIAASPAGYIQADPVVAGAEAFPQESFFFLVMEGREGFVIPFGMAVISSDL